MKEEAVHPSLLPVNSSPLERALDLGVARLLERIAPPFPELMSPAETPVEFLPYLAADRGVGEWRSEAPEAEKRLTVELAWPTARQAGTRKALENAAKGLQLIPEVRAWYEQTPPGAPYSFSVRAFTEQPYSEEIDARLDRRLADAKSERDTLTVSVGLSAFGSHSIAAATVCGELTTIYPIVVEGLEASGQAFMAAGLYCVETSTIYPQGS
ncbi:phage tail protein, P2 protein I family [Pseudomonas chlororaphis]|uniref:phage tail protein I n=1 Tax=Pseudomonas chlororaphis TaxID=587753 RepID=UPI0008797E98|nr:phage tail protein I [Pseudomonas chlororaphis]AZD65131.1 Tail protein I [Pseudomonas chlororaphis subsp. aurantiaca]QIT21284.1 phage tail protein I [Pseudomonas chlororaphis subsp. aurantiaca]WDH05437.1 phage tail protein I [Pseudomonas chlororaphis]WDH11808.1 phage tail protein I [Pseudomonas chlororaphis]SDT56676.1 phage tail protein, P2 protein I family [Pseudomonas chlororaphis]